MSTMPVMTGTIRGVSAAITHYPIMSLDKTLGVEDFEDSRISRQYAYGFF